MKSKHYFTLALIGGGVLLTNLAEMGCGSSDTTGNAPADNSTTGDSTVNSTVASTGTQSGVSASGTGAGGGATGNHDITMSTMINVDDPPAEATLVDAMTPDFYTFTGKAGDRIVINASAPGLQSENKSVDTTVTDLTLVLVGADMNLKMPLTYQDDGWPDFGQDATLYVQLPADGAYYIQVVDCNGLFTSGCPGAPADITNFDYELVVAHTSKLVNPEVLAAATQDGTTAKADKLTYVVPQGAPAGQYGPTLLGGDFKSATDTQVFSFTPPLDTVTTGRARAEFYVQVSGSNQGGDLSDTNVKIWATDSTGNVIISRSDQSNYVATTSSPLDLSLPVTLGQQYFLFVQNTQAAGSPAKDFYFVDHFLNPLIDVAEKEPADHSSATMVNDTSATAEMLTGQGTAKSLFTVDGAITLPGTMAWPTSDIDWFTFAVPASVTQYQVQCDSERTGSGVGGFTAELYAADATTMLTHATETTTTDILTMAAKLPASSTVGSAMFLKVYGATQDPVVTGTQYRCYVFFG